MKSYKLLLLLVCAMWINPTYAKEILKASGLPNFEYSRYEFSELENNLYLDGGYTQISANELIYWRELRTSNDGVSTRFYSYDLESETSSLLLNTTRADYYGALNSSQVLRVGSKLYIANDGKLYVLENNLRSIKLLRDFDTFYCCGAGFTNAQRLSMTNVAGVIYFNVFLDIDRSSPGRERARSVALWRSDGTVEGTYQLTQKIDTSDRKSYPSTVFANKGYKPDAAFFLMNETLFQIDGDRISEFNNYDKPGHHIRSTDSQRGNSPTLSSGVVQTKAGAFLCVSDIRGGDEYSKLWNFDKDGGLTEVAEGCYTLIKFNDKLILSRDSGLWLYNPETRSERLIAPGRVSYSANGCIIDNQLFVSLRGVDFNDPAQIYRITNSGQITNIAFKNKVAGANLSVSACVEETNSMVIFSLGPSVEGVSRSQRYFYYSPIESTEVKIRGRLDRVSRISSGAKSSTVFVPASSKPVYLDLINVTKLPFLEILLDEDEVTTDAALTSDDAF